MISGKPQITFQCPEKWENMKLGMVSRYCGSCKKDVQDFTRLSRAEILEYLWENRNREVCGRMYKSQLDFHHSEILITIHAYINKHKSSNLSFYLLTLGALIMTGCSEYDARSRIHLDSLRFELGPPIDHATVSDSIARAETDSLDSQFVTLGFVQIDSTDAAVPYPSTLTSGVSQCRLFAEEMPEYIGGVDELLNYFRDNLTYPRWEKKQKISGTVFVAFIVDAEGKIKEPKIVKSVPGSRNFDAEVLRLVNQMPDWKPGRENGEPVAVQYTMPVDFVL